MEVSELLANYGALGIGFALFVLGAIVSKPTHERESKRADRAEQQRDKVLSDVLEKVAPALERAAEAAKQRADYEDQVGAVLADVVDVLTDVRRLLESNGRQP